MTNVIINDYVTNKRITLFFLPHDFDLINEKWEEGDATLDRLQKINAFAGYLRWCDLKPMHFRIMIAKNIQSASFLAEEDRINDDNPVVSSLNFLICALINCIEKSSECSVETLKINRVGQMDIIIEYHAALDFDSMVTPKPKKEPFPVVVDNTRD